MAVGMLFMPETPSYLLSRDKPEAARRSLQFLRGSDYNVEDELAAIRAANEKSMAVGSITIWQLCSERVYAIPMLLMLAIMFFQQYSGINAIFFYLNTIFEQANTGMDSGLSSTLVSLVRVSF